MVNVLYDFVGMVPMVQPYVGAGIGYQDVIWQGVSARSVARRLPRKPPTGAALDIRRSSAWPFRFPTAPGLAFTAEYRFMGLAGNRSLWPGVDRRSGVHVHQRLQPQRAVRFALCIRRGAGAGSRSDAGGRGRRERRSWCSSTGIRPT